MVIQPTLDNNPTTKQDWQVLEGFLSVCFKTPTLTQRRVFLYLSRDKLALCIVTFIVVQIICKGKCISWTMARNGVPCIRASLLSLTLP